MDRMIRFHLNDQPIEELDARPTTTLLEYLRRQRHLVGTKEGCAEGDCGACTVAIVDGGGQVGATFRAINSCLVLLPLVHGKRVYTVEGLKKAGAHHPVQESLVRALGSQCGYCTPGIAMSMFEACYRQDLDAAWKLDDQMCGNLCRCTGYRPIREATATIAGLRPVDEFLDALGKVDASAALDYQAHGQRFVQPTTWEELWAAMDALPERRFICGATDLGLNVTKQRVHFPALVSLNALPELRGISRSPDGTTWRVGATTLLSDLEAAADQDLPILARTLRFFGSRQIKNRATVGGNLCNASPIGDLAPTLLALDATALARSRHGERRVPLDAFFVGYRKTALAPDEVLTAVEFDAPAPGARASAYKVSKRREMDISAVCAAMVVELDQAGHVRRARIAYGGMAATPTRAAKVEQALTGVPWNAEAIEAATHALDGEFSPIDDHRGSAWFRSTVAKNLLRGFYEETLHVAAPGLAERPTGTVQLGAHRATSANTLAEGSP